MSEHRVPSGHRSGIINPLGLGLGYNPQASLYRTILLSNYLPAGVLVRYQNIMDYHLSEEFDEEARNEEFENYLARLRALGSCAVRMELYSSSLLLEVSELKPYR